jgi:ArsR family transcriptional regulator
LIGVDAILPEASTIVNMFHHMKTVATISATCPPLLERALAPEEADELAGVLKALADPTRLRLLSLIQAQPDEAACVCHLVEPLGLSQGTVSHHLKALLTAGLVTREQRGSWAFYRVAPDALRSIRALLA